MSNVFDRGQLRSSPPPSRRRDKPQLSCNPCRKLKFVCHGTTARLSQVTDNSDENATEDIHARCAKLEVSRRAVHIRQSKS